MRWLQLLNTRLFRTWLFGFVPRLRDQSMSYCHERSQIIFASAYRGQVDPFLQRL